MLYFTKDIFDISIYIYKYMYIELKKKCKQKNNELLQSLDNQLLLTRFASGSGSVRASRETIFFFLQCDDPIRSFATFFDTYRAETALWGINVKQM